MDNAEEVMQLLEEFTKIKPKEIPRELDDYLGYVAKTGDPVYQWSLVKSLFREKLLIVITDFYESTLTVDLPPCPNVDPFNYERMKTSLLERFDTFCSAPFTVQRICELLTNPRKEYNRADKYMRAIEKNILVVSTREPGTAKRSLECDSQPEVVLNGMPEVKVCDSDGSLLHVPTDLPYLGAPPASNDVTIETTEPNSSISDRVGLEPNINLDSKTVQSDADKPWPSESASLLAEHSEQPNISTEDINTNVPLSIEEKSPEEINCDTNRCLDTDINSVNPEHLDGESSSDMFTQSSETVLPDSINSLDSEVQECNKIPHRPISKIENEETESLSDENEVSSTPTEASVNTVSLIQDEVEEPTDSEAEATDTSRIQDPEESGVCLLPDNEINSSDGMALQIDPDETKPIVISEVTATKSDEVDSECNEITGTVVSPISSENNSSLQTDDFVEENTNLGTGILEQSEQSDSHPDSSNDICLQNKSTSITESQNIESSVEADSMSETDVGLGLCPTSASHSKTELTDNVPDQTDEFLVKDIAESSNVVDAIFEAESLEKSPQKAELNLLSSTLSEEALVSESQASNSSSEDTIKLTDILGSNVIADEVHDQERREGSVIQSVPIITPDDQKQIIIEEISVDPSCEAEEEAMDVDDSSNQMMISEGENEGEPMDQSDQLQS